ncbi:polymorphic toxin type 37 domain-containing protein [Thermogemmata fonticola]|uniref:Toxin 37-like C-terminal domain-containing protein n=1 Tax=Thermogemmata fonticola TaxID=2755323 RepID=A0A7V8VGW4_9BACT|nr:hypothetical protein [Thermogemmata fonticola]
MLGLFGVGTNTILLWPRRGARWPGFPGSNPTKAPPGFEWRAKPGSTPGSREGNYYNPRTREVLRPDLSDPDPIGPHWDYIDPNMNRWRIFPDGRKEPKR